MTGDDVFWLGAIVGQPLLVWWLVGYWQRKRRPPWDPPAGASTEGSREP